MTGGLSIVFVVIVFVVIVIIMRFIGAWMLRIDEVISTQKEILGELKKSNKQKGIE